MKPWIIVVIAISAFIILMIGFVVLYAKIGANKLTALMVHPHYKERKAHQIALEFETKHPEYKEMPREDFELTLKDGYTIHGDISINNPKKVMIVAHGHGSTREGMMKYAYLYFKKGYTIILYDQRGHGDNVRVPCTAGDQESRDFIEMVDFAYEKFGKDISLSAAGTSMGAVTILLSLEYHPKLTFIIVDCPFASLAIFALKYTRKYHADRRLVLFFINRLLKKKYHTCLDNTDAIKRVKENEIPTLFIHGQLDQLIPVEHSYLLYDANKGPKEHKIFPEGTHGHSVNSDPEGYKKVVYDFIDRYEK